MIHIVEFPENAHATAWFAFDEADFARKVYATDPLPDWEIFDIASPRELLEQLDCTPETQGVQQQFPGICSLADSYGWDTVLYRADYLLWPGEFSPETIRERNACAAALIKRSKKCLIYWSDAAATEALENDIAFESREGIWGREALRDQLVALEILEGAQG